MRIKKKYNYYFIYLTKNIINNKCYIGWHATNNLLDGYIGSGKLIKRSIKKYGENNHITGIIEFYNKENILEKEIFWINQRNTKAPNGYNLTNGGDGGNTYLLLSDNDKKIFSEKSSKTHSGKKLSEKTKKKISESHIGHSWNRGSSFSEETKKKMKESRKGRKISKESIEKNRISQLGKKRTQECKDKIGYSNTIRIWKDESKEKIRKSHIGKTHSAETKEKIGVKFPCIYCGKEMNAGNLHRYHNENCKEKPI